MTVRSSLKSLLLGSAGLLAVACSGGGSSDPAPEPNNGTPPSPKATFDIPVQENLTVSDVETVLAQAVTEASARNIPASIAVVDRVGNVLAVFSMNGTIDSDPSDNTVSDLSTFENSVEPLRSGPNVDFAVNPEDNRGVQGISIVPRPVTAIAKAVTGAYLSSQGNAFTTRTASQIVQEHFPPAPTTIGLESGPLFGVQFSQLPCSDLNTRRLDTQSQFGATGFGGPLIGPKRSPLGLSADPGGIPLYKNGVVVGAIGVSADNDYGFDTNTLDTDTDIEELIAIAGAVGFAAPEGIRANRISVDGTFLRFSDATESDLMTDPSAAPSFTSINGVEGLLTPVASYYENTAGVTVRAGTAYGSEASGFRPATTAEFSNADAYVLSDGFGNNRYPAKAGTDGGNVSAPLTANEVSVLLEESFGIMAQARGQIRQPLNSLAQVTISIVDTNGEILGVIRGPDAPIFGTDVSLQKARTAAFFSGPNAADDLQNTTTSAVGDFARANPDVVADQFIPAPLERDYVQIVRDFLDDQTALTGTFAFADRSGGNLSRPYFPDGEVDTVNGPLSLPIDVWSPFATGLQIDLVLDNVIEHAAFLLGITATDTAPVCTFLPEADNASAIGENRLQNGIQIFPGSVPIYRDGELVGGIGVSGDGIDQDDMISFLGLHNAGLRLGTINNAPPEIRADNIVVPVNGEEIRLRYINCPFTPFVDSDVQNVCQGK
ncbi:MAG: heme-binding protein [Aquisalinus sp.]|nr:heme-binding protein [Aquisalinus sp.]